MQKTIITIKRPSGEIELVDISKTYPNRLFKIQFDKIKADTAKAGRGQCLSYTTEYVDTRPDSEKDYDLIVESAKGKLYDAENANYYDPAKIILAKQALEKAEEKWAEMYPSN